MNVYIIGPMSGLPGHNFAAFDTAHARLKAAGHHPISPANVSRLLGHDGTEALSAAEYEAALELDLLILEALADGVALLDGWEDSNGANREVDCATELGLDVWSLDIWVDNVPARMEAV